MTAIKACTDYLQEIEAKMCDMLNEEGYIKPGYASEYKDLQKESLETRKSIEYLKENNIGYKPGGRNDIKSD